MEFYNYYGPKEPVRPDKSSATPVIEVVNSLVRFRHVNEVSVSHQSCSLISDNSLSQHCYLHYSGMNLPNWGFEQGEVTCNPFYSKSGNLWNFETIADPRGFLLSCIAPTFPYCALHSRGVYSEAFETSFFSRESR
jgi:hypothetical protein